MYMSVVCMYMYTNQQDKVWVAEYPVIYIHIYRIAYMYLYVYTYTYIHIYRISYYYVSPYIAE